MNSGEPIRGTLTDFTNGLPNLDAMTYTARPDDIVAAPTTSETQRWSVRPSTSDVHPSGNLGHPATITPSDDQRSTPTASPDAATSLAGITAVRVTLVLMHHP